MCVCVCVCVKKRALRLNFMSAVYIDRTVIHEQSCTLRRLWKGEDVYRPTAAAKSTAATHQRWEGWGNAYWIPPDFRCVTHTYTHAVYRSLCVPFSG